MEASHVVSLVFTVSPNLPTNEVQPVTRSSRPVVGTHLDQAVSSRVFGSLRGMLLHWAGPFYILLRPTPNYVDCHDCFFGIQLLRPDGGLCLVCVRKVDFHPPQRAKVARRCSLGVESSYALHSRHSMVHPGATQLWKKSRILGSSAMARSLRPI